MQSKLFPEARVMFVGGRLPSNHPTFVSKKASCLLDVLVHWDGLVHRLALTATHLVIGPPSIRFVSTVAAIPHGNVTPPLMPATQEEVALRSTGKVPWPRRINAHVLLVTVHVVTLAAFGFLHDRETLAGGGSEGGGGGLGPIDAMSVPGHFIKCLRGLRQRLPFAGRDRLAVERQQCECLQPHFMGKATKREQQKANRLRWRATL